MRSMRLLVPAALLSLLSSSAWAAPADDVLLVEDADTRALMRVHVDGSGRTSLGLAADEYAAAYSPDSGLVAVYRPDGGLDVVDAVTGARRTLLVAADDTSFSVDWDPTGRWLVVVSQTDGETSVRIVAADGTLVRSLFPGQWEGGSYGPMGWAPDGSSVVIGGWEGRPAEEVVARVRVDGTARVAMPQLRQLAPQPGGTVAFGIEETDKGGRLVRYGADLTTRTVLRTMPQWGWPPEWSGDGSRVAVVTEPGVTRVFRPDGTQVAALGDDTWESFGLTWDSPALDHDGSVLLVHGDATTTSNWQADGMYALDVRRGRSCQITDIYTHPSAERAMFSPDGSYALLGNWSAGVTYRWKVAKGEQPKRALRADDVLVGWVTRPAKQVATTPCPPIRDGASGQLLVRRKAVDSGMRFTLDRGAAYPHCREGAKVKVQRKVKGSWETKRTVGLDRRGRAKVVVTKKGSYRFRIAERLVEPVQCRKTSTTVKW